MHLPEIAGLGQPAQFPPGLWYLRGHGTDMRAARSAALRLLYLAIAGTIVLPLVLFAYASWVDYRAAQQTADERIERSLDVVHEHASKVFEAIDLAFLQVAQLFRDIPDERIRADEQAFHLQLKT